MHVANGIMRAKTIPRLGLPGSLWADQQTIPETTTGPP
jgi:hypothetical protein